MNVKNISHHDPYCPTIKNRRLLFRHIKTFVQLREWDQDCWKLREIAYCECCGYFEERDFVNVKPEGEHE